MTEKDRMIQDLQRENAGLREELDEIVRATANCRFCKHIEEDCYPYGARCEPEWRGLNG